MCACSCMYKICIYVGSKSFCDPNKRKESEMFETMNEEYHRLFPTLPNSVLGD